MGRSFGRGCGRGLRGVAMDGGCKGTASVDEAAGQSPWTSPCDRCGPPAVVEALERQHGLSPWMRRESHRPLPHARSPDGRGKSLGRCCRSRCEQGCRWSRVRHCVRLRGTAEEKFQWARPRYGYEGPPSGTRPQDYRRFVAVGNPAVTVGEAKGRPARRC